MGALRTRFVKISKILLPRDNQPGSTGHPNATRSSCSSWPHTATILVGVGLLRVSTSQYTLDSLEKITCSDHVACHCDGSIHFMSRKRGFFLFERAQSSTHSIECTHYSPCTMTTEKRTILSHHERSPFSGTKAIGSDR